MSIFENDFMEDFTMATEVHPREDQFGEPAAVLFVYIMGNSDPIRSFVIASLYEADTQIKRIIAAGGFWASERWYPYHSISHFLVE